MAFYNDSKMKERIGLCYMQVEDLRQKNNSVRIREVIDVLDTIVKVMDDVYIYAKNSGTEKNK